MKPYQFLLPASVMLYLASLALPALLFAQHVPLSGLDVLAWGWWGLLTWDPAWYANPAYVTTIVLIAMRRFGAALVAGAFAVLVGISSFFAQAWWFNEGSGTPITALGTGFYVWLLALALAAHGALFAWKVNKSQPANSTEKPAP